MSVLSSWLFWLAVVLLLLAYWVVLDWIGTYCTTKLFSTPAGPHPLHGVVGGDRENPSDPNGGDSGIHVTYRHYRAPSFKTPAPKGFSKPKGRTA